MRSSGCVFALKVSEDLLVHRRFFDAGDDLNGTAPSLAVLEVDVENAPAEVCLPALPAACGDCTDAGVPHPEEPGECRSARVRFFRQVR